MSKQETNRLLLIGAGAVALWWLLRGRQAPEVVASQQTAGQFVTSDMGMTSSAALSSPGPWGDALGCGCGGGGAASGGNLNIHMQQPTGPGMRLVNPDLPIYTAQPVGPSVTLTRDERQPAGTVRPIGTLPDLDNFVQLFGPTSSMIWGA